MSGTKTQILEVLKRSGALGVAELAAALALAQVTVRQHLTHLERDRLIASEQTAGAVGRPRYTFQLTAKGHAAAFPRRSDRLVELLMREVGRLEGTELIGLGEAGKTSLVLRRVAERLADEYAPLLLDLPLRERVAFVTKVMHADGGFAEWEETASGYEIRDFNCLFHRLLNSEGANDVCEWHHSFLSRTLGTDVTVVPHRNGANGCCRYAVEAAVPAMASVRA